MCGRSRVCLGPVRGPPFDAIRFSAMRPCRPGRDRSCLRSTSERSLFHVGLTPFNSTLATERTRTADLPLACRMLTLTLVIPLPTDQSPHGSQSSFAHMQNRYY